MLEVGERPWGKYYVLADEPNYKLKRIEVMPGHRLSYQYHLHRQENWTIIQGHCEVIINEIATEHSYGQSIFIAQSAKHRIKNIGTEILIFIEIQTGTYFGEDDIIRLQDDYQRKD
jgi:mannose-6-phosphate isomerase